MATAAVNHRIIPPPLLTQPSISIPLLSAKRQLCLRTSPLITLKNLTYPEKCSFRVTSCISSSSSRRIRFHPSARLYVSGLSYRTTEESLRNAFEKFGELLEVTLVMDKIANRPRGIAFLRYATKEEAEKAIERMHGKFLDGRVIFVEIAKTRADRRQESDERPLRQGFNENPLRQRSNQSPT